MKALISSGDRVRRLPDADGTATERLGGKASDEQRDDTTLLARADEVIE